MGGACHILHIGRVEPSLVTVCCPMEPLSFAASLIAVVGATDVVLNSIRKLRSLSGALDAIDALLGEVEALRTLLRDIEQAQVLLEQVSPPGK